MANEPEGFLPQDPRAKNIAGYGYVPGITKAGEEYEKATQEAIDALKERYSTPNWGKIAAAFARPHLGGAFEALGDVGSAIGERLEEAKDAKIKIAQMRAQLAAYKYPAEQQAEAQRIFNQAWENEGGPTPKQTANIALFGGSTPAAAVGQGREAGLQKVQSAIAILSSGLEQAKNAITMNKLDKGILSQILNDPVYRQMAQDAGVLDTAQTLFLGGDNKPPAPPSSLDGQTPSETPPADGSTQQPKVQRKTPPGTPESLLLSAQSGAITNEDYKNRVNENTALWNKDRNALGTIKNNSQYIFNTASKAYDIASKPSLRQFFGIGRSGKARDIAIQIMEGSSLGKIFGGTPSSIMKQLGMSEEQFTDLNNLAREMYNLKAAAATNPAGTADPDQKFANQTDYRTELETMANPSFGDSQMSALKGLAMIASKAMIGLEAPDVLKSFVENPQNDINDFKSSAELYALGEKHKARSDDILNKYPPIDPKTGKYMKPLWFQAKSSAASSGSSRPQDVQTSSGKLVKIDGKWVRQP